MQGRIGRIAIAHDYLTQRGGAEKVVLSLARAFPDAPIYTTLYSPEDTFPEFKDLDVRTSFLNKVSLFRSQHRLALPLLAFAVRSVRIDADVVVVSTSGWAHGYRASGKKLVYCHSPARWLYQADAYLGNSSGVLRRVLLKGLKPFLKEWDLRMAAESDRYLSNSSVVRSRVRETYGIEARVVPAPHRMDALDGVECPRMLEGVDTGDFFLCVSRLLPYKNVDKVVDAFSSLGRRLVVVGSGPELNSLKRRAGANVSFLQNISDSELGWLYMNCQGLVAASYEDYGLTPVEAAFWGKACVALRWGGYLDTIVEGVNGVFFDNPESDAISQAVLDFETRSWDADLIVKYSQRFAEDRFLGEMRSEVESLHI
ncbi:glycosyltransferase family 4 protein [Rhodococcus sp. 14C212]|nr:glycosyltransferase [Rhodococcus sp. 14C212]NGP07714.1 glycosyltransferase family 4 protein [Rhodococcus sp. 14C212]